MKKLNDVNLTRQQRWYRRNKEILKIKRDACKEDTKIRRFEREQKKIYSNIKSISSWYSDSNTKFTVSEGLLGFINSQ